MKSWKGREKVKHMVWPKKKNNNNKLLAKRYWKADITEIIRLINNIIMKGERKQMHSGRN